MLQELYCCKSYFVIWHTVWFADGTEEICLEVAYLYYKCWGLHKSGILKTALVCKEQRMLRPGTMQISPAEYMMLPQTGAPHGKNHTSLLMSCYLP